MKVLGMYVTEKQNHMFGKNHLMVSWKICLFSKVTECLMFLNHRNGFAVNLVCMSEGDFTLSKPSMTCIEDTYCGTPAFCSKLGLIYF